MYFHNQREKFLQKAQEMGMDMYQVADFVDQKCICENDFGIIMDNMSNPNYMNVLRPIMYA